MRITSYPAEESDVAFDFSAAIWCDRHDVTNTASQGVDFIIEEPDRQIWLEVKNWHGVSVLPHRRGGQAKSFLAKLRGKQKKTFFKEVMRGKFISTVAYFALQQSPLTKPILYVALLESSRMDAHILSTSTTELRSLVRAGKWAVPVEAIVVNLAEWQVRFPEYPAHAV